MAGQFDKAKQLYQLQKEAKAIQKELRETEIEAKSKDGAVTVVINGEQHIKSIAVAPEYLNTDKKIALEQELVKVVSEAINRAQMVAAERTKHLMGNMGIDLPGM